MLILAIDSTSKKLSISISSSGRILSSISDSKSDKHMANIICDIEKALKTAGKNLNDIEAFAVNLGPGDFTGGRIGISIVKIFSLLSSKPVYGHNSLDVFAAKSFIKNKSSIIKTLRSGRNAYIFPLMDVRNKEIYFGIYEAYLIEKNNMVSDENNYKDENTILCTKTKNQSLCLKKKFTNYLLSAEDIKIKIQETINQLLHVADSCCSSCLSFFNERSKNSSNFCVNNQTDLKNKEKIISDGSGEKNKFIITGNIFPQYEYLFEDISTISLAAPGKLAGNYEMPVEKNNTIPESKYLNYLAEYAYENNLKPAFISPVYVRDFTVFKKEKN